MCHACFGSECGVCVIVCSMYICGICVCERVVCVNMVCVCVSVSGTHAHM